MARTTIDNGDEGAGALPLAPVVDMGSWYGEAGLADLPKLAPLAVSAANDVELGDILADAVFGEVIDISDLLPGLFGTAPGHGDATVGDAVEADPADMSGDLIDLGSVFAATTSLAALFDNDANGHAAL